MYGVYLYNLRQSSRWQVGKFGSCSQVLTSEQLSSLLSQQVICEAQMICEKACAVKTSTPLHWSEQYRTSKETQRISSGAYLRCQSSCRKGRTCPSPGWRALAAQTCQSHPRSPAQTASPPVPESTEQFKVGDSNMQMPAWLNTT